jgi:hypothetical protein
MSDVVTLPCALYMVEVECKYIFLATINTRISFQVVINPVLDFDSSLQVPFELVLLFARSAV